MARFFFTFLLLGITLSTNSMAHSIRLDVEEHPPAVKVHSYFSRTSPLVDAKVEVFKPGSDAIYQRGRTDEAGYFAFIPAEAGDWVVTVDDERGHIGRTVVSITEAFFRDEQPEELPGQPTAQSQYGQGNGPPDHQTDETQAEQRDGRQVEHREDPQHEQREAPAAPATEPPAQTTRDIPLIYRVIFGLALIFGITGFLYGMKGRNSKNSSQEKH